MTGSHTADRPRFRRAPIFLSALVWPGAGHWMQRRRLAGAFFGAAFAGALAVMCAAAWGPLYHNLQASIEFAQRGDSPPFRAIDIGRILWSLGIAMAVYFAALLDCARGEQRILRRKLIAYHGMAENAGGRPAPTRR